MPRFQLASRFEVPVEELFAWHEREGAYERLTPPWAAHEVLERDGNLEGGRARIRVPWIGPFRTTWIAVHDGYERNRQFRDRQERGPFARFEHVHRFAAEGPGACRMEDEIDYELPGGSLGEWLGAGMVARRLRRVFEFRHRRTRGDLERHRAVRDRGTRTVAITGASGMIGRPLAAFLTTGGHAVRRVGRGVPAPGRVDVRWDPARDELDASALEGVDAVVHLAGENVGAGRWSAARKAEILESRRRGTGLIARALAGLARKPRVLVCASATGWYGNRAPGETVDEGSSPGEGFLAEVCREWEAAAEPARAAGIRVVHLRLGVVLAAGGGALARMLPPFRMGAGGPVGAGTQPLPWIALDDAVGVFHHAIFAEDLFGAVNAVAPECPSNAEFGRTLGRVLNRPAFLPLPAFAVRAAFGEMGRALLLEGARVRPARLEGSGFRFLHPRLEDALREELGRVAGPR